MATLDWIRRAALREQPLTTRLRARWLLCRLTAIDRAVENSFVGDAGYSLSNIINGGRTARLEAKAGPVMKALSEITVGSMQGLEVIEFPIPYRRGDLVQSGGKVYSVLASKVTDRGPVEHLCRCISYRK